MNVEWQELQDQITAVFDFLGREFDYSPPFPISVRSNNVVVVGYRNLRAARQVEVSGHSDSYVAHCEIRRLIDGTPGDYGPHSITDWELRMMGRWFGDEASLFKRDEILRRIALTLRKRPDILRGTAWIDRTDIDRKSDRELVRKFGPPPPGGPCQHPLDIARDRAAFLVTEHGFVLEFDSAALSPHEWELSDALRYRRGETTVEIVNTDNRIWNEWVVRVDGAAVDVDFTAFDTWLAAALAEVIRRIC